MKRFASTLICVIALAAMSCGGAQPPTTAPQAASESDNSEPAAIRQDEAASGESSGQARTSPKSDSAPSGSPVEREETQDDGGDKECRKSAAKLSLTVDRASVSLEQGVLEARMDGPICKIALTIIRKDGLSKIEETFHYTTPRRELRYSPVPRDQVEKIEIRISAADGAQETVYLVPWSVSIDHQEVVFDTDKAEIRPSEVGALTDSLAKIKQVLQTVENKGLGKVTLFIAGHTDTRGTPGRNLDLSRRRAQAIAAWFQQRGLCIPIAFEGFGEGALKILTQDEVDSQENRRVDYIMAVEPPVVSKGVKPAWKWISKGC